MISTQITTLTPNGREGMQIALETYSDVKNCLVGMLKNGPLPFKALCARSIPQLIDKFEGSPMWYIVNVKLDLEAKGEILSVSKGKSQLVMLAN